MKRELSLSTHEELAIAAHSARSPAAIVLRSRCIMTSCANVRVRRRTDKSSGRAPERQKLGGFGLLKRRAHPLELGELEVGGFHTSELARDDEFDAAARAFLVERDETRGVGERLAAEIGRQTEVRE